MCINCNTDDDGVAAHAFIMHACTIAMSSRTYSRRASLHLHKVSLHKLKVMHSCIISRVYVLLIISAAHEPPKVAKEHATSMYARVPSKYKFVHLLEMPTRIATPSSAHGFVF